MTKELTKSALHGVIPPLVTPLDEQGEVDRRSLERVVSDQLDAGVHGVFVGGSTGEIALLDTARRTAAIEVVTGTVAGAVPVLAGAVDTGTLRVVEHARQAVRLGADAVVVTTPFYIRPHRDEIVEHFRQVHAAVDAPVIGYDIVSATGSRLTADIVAELASSGLIAGLKDSSGDLASFREILRRTELPAFTGSELLADTAVQLGGAGIVPGLGNVDPHGYVRLYRAVRESDVEAASAEQDRLARLFAITSVADQRRIGLTASVLGAYKAAMALRGLIDHPGTHPPLLPLNEAETRTIADILSDTGLLGS
ncbi:4-hydroxy-tetrahydrodipicolinate synthase [Saccharomonospora amisosensis]|uniref:4-hydroxy-tetrahydrodipicolinate synthase n=1 Tax=Saccharomonospora amisosensis TaxID=1128677 RepID=A0A7X5USW3_9PSEU|nr:dihydrodipicolinate synthase family protein [Saccharomonospora amisosensis]NIJ13282.1 4-hydroxy-tetrahydrodipicolinate synthase [Saccharomonospora amisosensis]